MTLPSVALFHDYTDAAEYLNTHTLKGRNITRLVPQNTAKQYAQQIERMFVMEKVTEFVFPTTWEMALTKANREMYEKIFGMVSHLPIKMLSPLQDTTLETVISKLRTRKTYAGICTHWTKENPSEHCGMCLGCLSKYLILKKLNRPTEDIFLEDPIDGFEGRVRLYNLMTTIVNPLHKATRLEVTVATLIADCFMKDVFPKDLSDTMEKRFKKFLQAWGSEV